MPNKILVYIEQRNGSIKKSSLEAVKAAEALSGQLNSEVSCLIIGRDVQDIESIGGYGAAKAVFYKNENLNFYSPSAYADIIFEYAKEIGADILLFANTALGKDLAPRAAAKLDAGIAADCIRFDVAGGEVTAMRPIYAGKALSEVKINSAKKVFTIRPNVFPLGEKSGAKAVVEVKTPGNLNLAVKTTGLKKSEGKLDVAEASIIVSGGRGLKAPENFKMVEDLAESLGAAVGASRAVVDAGWRPHSEQVGQTGKTVSPNLYIAVGISGAIQHLAGMRSSKYIV
ncbi:MAG TPA: electron transfer flavoprotein subunit alpha/FixB family protein, partial [Ignavibacteriales bacterium]|nr:electron transfer flavoprotein subunit alpha/FixB family protein [Ignavibacteriales bacterium]